MGKTALADLIAYGAESYEPGPASFLGRAEAVRSEGAGRDDLVWCQNRIDEKGRGIAEFVRLDEELYERDRAAYKAMWASVLG